MVRQPDAILEAQKSIALKLNEPELDSDNPWADDLLAREGIATRLTNLVATQEEPLTISLHGQWGTGKTFMLRRWQKDIENRGFRAIYFNAWEDDFCDDPLLAFIGQLSEYFKETGLKALAEKAAQIAIPLIRENLLGLLRASTGITIAAEKLAQSGESLLETYHKQRATKDELKKHLATLADKVAVETGHPLVFIIDELDRCRPTFAIELLERVKHIFDVPHIVFVFGLNRDELCKSLKSVYEEIDADVYLRRFFDFEFYLREVDSEEFTRSQLGKFQLDILFRRLNSAGIFSYERDYENFVRVCPKLWSALNLSLRDIDYSIRLIALLTRNMIVGANTYPYLLALLIGFKFKRPHFYHSMVSGNFRTNQIVNYLTNESILDPSDGELNRHFDRIEGFLYCAESANPSEDKTESRALYELQRVGERETGISFEILTNRAQHLDQEGRERIRQAIKDGPGLGIDKTVFARLAEWIDAYQADLRR